jgi:transcription initiation factor TFIID TATA-box-binding protein
MVGRTGDATVGDATVEPRDTIEIVNVVASTGIGIEINLKQTTLALEGADYDPERFPGLVYRTKDPKTAALIFRSGKIVCTGAKSIDDVYRGLENVFQSLRNIGIDVKGTPEIKVQNIVASADLHSVLNLNAIALGLGFTGYRNLKWSFFCSAQANWLSRVVGSPKTRLMRSITS